MKRREGSWKVAVEELEKRNPKVLCGMFDESRWNLLTGGFDCFYFDNPYFLRQEKHSRFRLIRGGTHLTKILPVQPLRSVYTPVLCPWKKAGKGIIVIPPSERQIKIYDAYGWIPKTLKRLSRASGRNVMVKYDKTVPLLPLLDRAWAVVTFASVAGIEAVIAGIPVFSTFRCPTFPVSSGELEDVDDPDYPDREEWLRSLAYACWTVNDLKYLDLENYDYTCRHHRA